MTSKQLIKAARILTVLTFFGGSVIFIWFWFAMSNTAMSLGFGWIVLTVVFNLGLLVIIIVRSLSDEEHRSKLLSSGALMFLNIPVMFVYIGLTVMILNRLRITIKNPTSYEITDIKLHGCEELELHSIPANESRNVWVYISSDCSVDIEYKVNGKQKTDNVVGYTTPGMGALIMHQIKP